MILTTIFHPSQDRFLSKVRFSVCPPFHKANWKQALQHDLEVNQFVSTRVHCNSKQLTAIKLIPLPNKNNNDRFKSWKILAERSQRPEPKASQIHYYFPENSLLSIVCCFPCYSSMNPSPVILWNTFLSGHEKQHHLQQLDWQLMISCEKPLKIDFLSSIHI